MKALSIRQPWAWLILHAGKDIENRSWRSGFRGRLLIHAGVSLDRDALRQFEAGRSPATGEPFPPDILEAIHRIPWRGGVVERGPDLERGGIVGSVEIVDCVTRSDSPWFFGPVGFVLRNPVPVPFQPCRGQLGFFTPATERT